ncbi:MAG: M42 family metallopeptidase [Firmicutes bacterium]|nr:M42 family metallopeptidase [Bacillota bacterium]
MLIDTLKTLCYLSGVSGAEDEVRDYILERVMPLADEVRTDALGNVLVFKKGAKSPEKSLMLCAHMDEVGLIVTHITDEGLLKFDFVGSVDRRVVLGKRVFVGKDRVPGVIGVKPTHLLEKDEKSAVPKLDALFIDIGAESREEALNFVGLGDVCVFDDNVMEFGDGYLSAKAIDDRVGCAVSLELLEEELPRDAWFAFSVQEEVGTRGAYTAAFALKPDIAVALEGTTAADLPSVEEFKQVCNLGGGPVLPFMDRGSIANTALRNLLISVAEKNGIPWQTKRLIAGGTDAGAIQRTGEGARVAGLAAPVRGIHSPICVAKISDMEDMLRLSRLFLKASVEF